ncbi:DUF547 domain-containing protein [Aquimarina sp. ERC-38]|uniref:DUF547 domain-containing protein n=1 Tax=Aquimarina sp. ERC-38 TaxID=2949996 RepID=UPI002247CF9A|nr:DUF547 domain-containing protein [Aquimarina sp. ERC-38]UZO81244.1 DUF547 domain-containing protein [Aquimarina sp. ERC-38]
MKTGFIYLTTIFFLLSCSSNTSFGQEKNKGSNEKKVSDSTISKKTEANKTIPEDSAVTDAVKKRNLDTESKNNQKVNRPPIPIEEKAPDNFPEETIPKKEKVAVARSVDKDKSNQTKIASQHALWNELLSKHVTDQGKVNYKGFQQDQQKLDTYLKMLSNKVPSEEDTKNSKLAFWMNAYNAFTIKLILDNYPITSIKDIKDPWGQRFFQLGEERYNLNDVEHKVLRKLGDPRIHFGINCASVSCPALSNKAFTTDNVQKQLDVLTKQFINNTTYNSINEDRVEISKIFNWFSKDFKTEGSLIDFLNQYATTTIRPNAKISYKDYNWQLNN